MRTLREWRLKNLVDIYEVNIGKVWIVADNEEDAKIGACQYVGGDYGIDNATCKIKTTEKEMFNIANSEYPLSDEYDHIESDSKNVMDDLEEIESENGTD